MKRAFALLLLLLFVATSSKGGGLQIVKIDTDHQSFVFSAASEKPLMFRYWGARLSEEDAGAILSACGREKSWELYPAYGGALYTNPALTLVHADGQLTTELVFSSCHSRQLDENRTETIIVLQDKVLPLTVELRFTAFRQQDIVMQSVTVRNREQGPVIVRQIASAFFSLKAMSYYLTHFHGSSNAEMWLKEELLTPGIKTIDSKKGVRTTHNENSCFIVSVNGPAKEDDGEVYGGALAWSGNFESSFQLDDFNMLQIRCGLNPFCSEIRLLPGESFTTPEAVVGYSDRGKGQLTRNFHRWARRYALAHGDRYRSVALNNWEGTHWNFNEKDLREIIDKAAEIGCELFILDDGWFGGKYPRNDATAGLGDWQVNAAKLPGGLQSIAGYAAAKGLRFGIWIEPEMVNPHSELAQEHSEWIVRSGEREIPTLRHQWILDLCNPDVQDFIFGVFDDLLSSAPGISYVKWDANRHVNNVGSTYLPADEQSRFWVDYTRGLYNVYERIRSKYPDIEIQACASGGGRVDFGSLPFHDEIWTSDNTNAIDRIFIQWGTNHFFPTMAMAAHVSAAPNRQTGMSLPLKFRCDVAMSGRMGIELDPRKLAREEIACLQDAVAAYKTIRPVVQHGDLYRLVSPYDESGWAALNYVSETKERCVLFAFSTALHTRTRLTLRLKGLDPAGYYKITEQNRQKGKTGCHAEGQTLSGDYLMKCGVGFDLAKPFESCVLLLERQDR